MKASRVKSTPPAHVHSSSEVAAAISGEIARCSLRALEQAELLESVGVQSFEIGGEIFRDATAQELNRRSHALRGLVLHALGVLAELQHVSGRLDALAALRAAEEAEDDGLSTAMQKAKCSPVGSRTTTR